MPIGTWTAFAAALVVALAVPGPDFVLVVQAATRGTRHGLTTAAGIVTGLCLHAGLAIAGVAAVLISIPSAMILLRLIGVTVLIWLGVSMLRSWRTGPHQPTETRSDYSRGFVFRGFVRGFLTNAANPKALLFFAAILPQFIGTGVDARTRTVVLAATVVLGSALWWTAAVTLVRVFGLGRSGKADRLVTLAGGVTLTTLAVLLAALTLADPSGPSGPS